MAEALYRKYRPQVFEDVVGQEPIERTLKNAIGQDKVSHAYLFCGPRGTGKTTTARLLAKALLCGKGPTPDPDGTCEDCQMIADGAHPDVYELDAASRTGVENVREEIISRVHFAPTRGRYKVYIIDEVHMLSTAAFNALLKTLEEPPGHVVFILCTTDPQKVPETIHSRCQRFDFHRISPESMVARLGAVCVAEDVEFEGEALDLIAQRAGGGLRDALTSLEQIIAFENGKVTLAGAERLLGSIDSNDLAEIIGLVGRRDIAGCFRWTANIVETGADLAQFARDMAEHVRNLYLMTLAGDDVELDVSETARRELAGELAWFGADRAARLLGVLGDLMAELKTTSNPRLTFEIALTRMVRPDSDLTLESLAERIEALESGYSAVAHVVSAPAASPIAPAQGEAPQATAAPAAQEPEPAPVEASSAPAVVEAAAPVEPVQEQASEASQAQAQASRAQAAQTQVPQVQVAQEQVLQEQAARGGGAPVLSNPAAMQRIWQAALADVKKQKQAHGVLFMGVKARFDEAAGAVIVSFPADNGFAFNAARKPDVQDALGTALERAAGAPVQFRFEMAGDSAAAPAAEPIASERPEAETAAAVPSAVPAAAEPAASENVAIDSATAVSEFVASKRSAVVEALAAEPAAARQSIAIPASEQVVAAQQPAAAVAAESATAASAPAQPAGAATFDSADQVPYDEVPYDEVPYDEVPYDEVPYDDFAASDFAFEPEPAPIADFASAAQPMPEPDASATPSPAEPATTPDGVSLEDPSAVEAMLQASFGASVVLSEAVD